MSIQLGFANLTGNHATIRCASTLTNPRVSSSPGSRPRRSSRSAPGGAVPSRNLCCDSYRNGGAYDAKAVAKLELLLQDCMQNFKRPRIQHVRMRIRDGQHSELPKYIHNLLSRKGLPYGFVKATESDPEPATTQHTHYFFVFDAAYPDAEKILNQLYWGCQTNGYIRSFYVAPVVERGDVGEQWKPTGSESMELSEATFPDCLYWTSYGIKARSKDSVRRSGKHPLRFRYYSKNPAKAAGGAL